MNAIVCLLDVVLMGDAAWGWKEKRERRRRKIKHGRRAKEKRSPPLPAYYLVPFLASLVFVFVLLLMMIMLLLMHLFRS